MDILQFLNWASLFLFFFSGRPCHFLNKTWFGSTDRRLGYPSPEVGGGLAVTTPVRPPSTQSQLGWSSAPENQRDWSGSEAERRPGDHAVKRSDCLKEKKRKPEHRQHDGGNRQIPGTERGAGGRDAVRDAAAGESLGSALPGDNDSAVCHVHIFK